MWIFLELYQSLSNMKRPLSLDLGQRPFDKDVFLFDGLEQVSRYVLLIRRIRRAYTIIPLILPRFPQDSPSNIASFDGNGAYRRN